MRAFLSKLLLPVQDIFRTSAEITPPPQGTFVKGINLGGAAVTIAGNPWDAHSTALQQGLVIPKASLGKTAIAPKPYVNADLRRMLNTVVFNPETLVLEQALPNGTYDLYLWIMENYRSHWHSLDVSIQGQPVATGLGHLPVRHWIRTDAFPVTVTNENVHISITTHTPNVDAHLMGLSFFQK